MTISTKKRRLVPLLVALVSTACAGPGKTAQPVQPVYDKQTGELTGLTYDENGNTRVDTWVHLDGTRILRAEADHDEDGRIDRWEHYRAEGSQGQIARIEISTRRDGRIDRIELFVGGILDQVQQDTNHDGRTDKWETYRNSALAMVAFDIHGRGTPDRRLVYKTDGSLDHLETDANGDGAFEAVAARP